MNATRGTATTAIVVATATTVAAAASWLWVYQRRKRRKRNFLDSPSVRIQTPIRHTRPLPGQKPRIVYLTGIDKEATAEELIALFSSAGVPPLEVDVSEVAFTKGGGRAWALYPTPEAALATVQTLHQTVLRGCTLCARLEWGVGKDGKRITDTTVHTAVLRSIQPRRGTTKTKKVHNKPGKNSGNKDNNGANNGKGGQHDPLPPISYSHKSLNVGNMEFPFPSGLYLAKIIQQQSKVSSGGAGRLHADGKYHQQPDAASLSTTKQENNLLDLLSSVSKLGRGSVMQYAKEISEAIAMVDAVERALSQLVATEPTMMDGLLRSVTCYCLGDGKYPVAASALAWFMPKHWEYVSIDPLLDVVADKDDVCNGNNTTAINHATSFHDRIQLFCGMSQDFSLPKRSTSDKNYSTNHLSIVVACHSHAPLEEFWGRLECPKLCIAMPCCAQYSELPLETPMMEYDNFEVYSPKRRIRIYFSQD
jgi:hypothetical protein